MFDLFDYSFLKFVLKTGIFFSSLSLFLSFKIKFFFFFFERRQSTFRITFEAGFLLRRRGCKRVFQFSGGKIYRCNRRAEISFISSKMQSRSIPCEEGGRGGGGGGTNFHFSRRNRISSLLFFSQVRKM